MNVAEDLRIGQVVPGQKLKRISLGHGMELIRNEVWMECKWNGIMSCEGHSVKHRMELEWKGIEWNWNWNGMEWNHVKSSSTDHIFPFRDLFVMCCFLVL